jgi:hypothetical protein
VLELETKPDFQRCLDRVEAWWDRAVLDRPPVTLRVRPQRPPRDVPAHHGSIRERWLDGEYVLDCVAARMEAGIFPAESFPAFLPNLGPDVCATCYGATLEFAEGTSWSSPCVDDIRDVPNLQPNLQTPCWEWIRRMTDLSIRRGAGRWITSLADLHTNGDLLAALRGPQNLATDFADDFEAVQAACRHVTPHAAVFYDDLCAPIAAAGMPTSTWGIVLSRGRCYYANCDFICMISPRMFAETILPAIEWEIARLDRSIFHLDGPGALVHLDALLALERLDAVQWVYGAGAEPAARWIDVYRRCLDAGKAVEVHCQDMADARAIMEQLPPEGVWLHVGGGHSRQEADAILAEVERWAQRRRL